MTEYWPAPAAARIADELIEAHHPHLIDHRIEFVFRDKAAKRHGRIVLGTARKVTGLNAFLARPVTSTVEDLEGGTFFLIELAGDHWPRLTDAQQRAVVDHELCHCWVEWDEDQQQHVHSIRGHDIEEFNDIVRRHGAWKPDVAAFAETLQLALFDRPDEAA